MTGSGTAGGEHTPSSFSTSSSPSSTPPHVGICVGVGSGGGGGCYGVLVLKGDVGACVGVDAFVQVSVTIIVAITVLILCQFGSAFV